MADGYIKCPRCRGSCQVFAYTEISNGFTPSRGEYFTCPLCGGTGEADADRAKEWSAANPHDEEDEG